MYYPLHTNRNRKEIIMETTISIEIEIPIEEFEKKLLETCEKLLTNKIKCVIIYL